MLSRLLLAWAILTATPLQASTLSAPTTFLQGKEVWEFYKTAVNNPQQIFLLSLHIKEYFSDSSSGYKDLNNELAAKNDWFKGGLLGKEFIELGAEQSSNDDYDYYSITLKKLTFKQCNALSHNSRLNDLFERVEVNNLPVSNIKTCKSQWFFQSGKNTIKYIAR